MSWPLSSPEFSTAEEAPVTQRSAVLVRSQQVVTPSPSEVSMKSIPAVDEHDAVSLAFIILIEN